MEFDEISRCVIGAAIEVHKTLGPGLLESTYEKCLCHELKLSKINFISQVTMPVAYKGINLDCGYRIDLLVEGKLIVELKSVSTLKNVHEAQILTYMKLSKTNTGLLINFNESLLKKGIKRFVL